MQKEDDRPLEELHLEADQAELSNVWLELLGLDPSENHVRVISDQLTVPTLDGDPWGELLRAENIEVVDLQRVHLPVSDREVEQMLQLMQERNAQDPGDSKDFKN